jgi:hypothetical protein
MRQGGLVARRCRNRPHRLLGESHCVEVRKSSSRSEIGDLVGRADRILHFGSTIVIG